jgi:hypothetical protein
MKAKKKFKKLFEILPEQAKRELIINAYTKPMSINVCWLEIIHNTKLGNDILKQLGFKDD